MLTSFALVCSLVPSISIAPCDFVFRFALYNLSGGGCPSDTLINVHSLCQIRLSNRYVHTAGRRHPFLVHLDCAIACTITFSIHLSNRVYYHFSNSFVQSLCPKKFFQKIVSSDVLHIQGTSALGCSTLLLFPVRVPYFAQVATTFVVYSVKISRVMVGRMVSIVSKHERIPEWTCFSEKAGYHTLLKLLRHLLFTQLKFLE